MTFSETKQTELQASLLPLILMNVKWLQVCAVSVSHAVVWTLSRVLSPCSWMPDRGLSCTVSVSLVQKQRQGWSLTVLEHPKDILMCEERPPWHFRFWFSACLYFLLLVLQCFAQVIVTVTQHESVTLTYKLESNIWDCAELKELISMLTAGLWCMEMLRMSGGSFLLCRTFWTVSFFFLISMLL